MLNHKSILSLIVTSAVFGLVACASGGGAGDGATTGAEPTGDEISIQVTNDISPPTGVVVWVVPENSSRRRLGSVPPNGRRSFNYTPMLQSGQIYLLAVPEGPVSGTMQQPSERKSNLFSVLGVRTVGWSVTQLNVRTGG
jgi:hypothetical protein